MTRDRLSIAYISYNLPALTTTFIYREFLELRRRGVDIRLISLKRPEHSTISEEVRWLVPEIIYLKPIPLASILLAQFTTCAISPNLYFRMFFYALTRKTSGVRRKLRLLYHFFVSCYLSRKPELRDVDHFHAHFASGPTSVALFTAELLNKPFSFTAHAIDIYVDDIDIKSKVHKSRFANVISEYNRHHLKEIVDPADLDKLRVVYYGIDVDRYSPKEDTPDGTKDFRILSIARLVEKKGHKYLIEACKILSDRGYDFSCEILGSGPLKDELCVQVREAELEGRVSIPGPVLQEEVTGKLQEADLFVLPCVIADDGDRDGIPNSLIEAMVMEVPVVSCDVAGISELIINGENGFLVPERDAKSLSSAIAKIIDDPRLRHEMRRNGRKTVLDHFNIKKNVDELLRLFEEAVR